VPDEPIESHEPSLALTHSLSFLVVDDDPLVLANTTALVEDLGHRVEAVDNGEAALAVIARAEHIDLLITDQMMPNMTGAIGQVRPIRKARPTDSPGQRLRRALRRKPSIAHARQTLHSANTQPRYRRYTGTPEPKRCGAVASRR
jgi:CheY-like chemotaxis protein